MSYIKANDGTEIYHKEWGEDPVTIEPPYATTRPWA